jgi:hypothetical protein
MDFDWKAWSDLARNDPEAFEARRRESIAALIDSAPAEHRRRLEGLQFRIDLERTRSRHPFGACVRLSNLMWKSLLEMQSALEDLQAQLTEHGRLTTREPPATAEVVPFPRRN